MYVSHPITGPTSNLPSPNPLIRRYPNLLCVLSLRGQSTHYLCWDVSGGRKRETETRKRHVWTRKNGKRTRTRNTEHATDNVNRKRKRTRKTETENNGNTGTWKRTRNTEYGNGKTNTEARTTETATETATGTAAGAIGV